MSFNLYMENGPCLYQTPTPVTFELLGGEDPECWDHEETRNRYIQWVRKVYGDRSVEQTHHLEEHIKQVLQVEEPVFYWL